VTPRAVTGSIESASERSKRFTVVVVKTCHIKATCQVRESYRLLARQVEKDGGAESMYLPQSSGVAVVVAVLYCILRCARCMHSARTNHSPTICNRTRL
jgi:hypothetical protein